MLVRPKQLKLETKAFLFQIGLEIRTFVFFLPYSLIELERESVLLVLLILRFLGFEVS